MAPSEINWDKSHDITWLYGPKYEDEVSQEVEESLTPHLKKLDFTCDSDAELVSSCQLGRSLMNFDEVSSVESDEEEASLKLAMRRDLRGPAGSGKKVKFNYIVSSREFVNGVVFDYDFLDPLCL